MIPKMPALGLDPRVGTGFRKRSCSNNKLERDGDSKKSHRALAPPVPPQLREAPHLPFFCSNEITGDCPRKRSVEVRAVTELAQAELTDGQGRALSGHRTQRAYEG